MVVIDRANVALPSNLSAERVVIGALIEDDKLLPEIVRSGLVASDFQLADHRRVFAAICDLRRGGTTVDVITVSEHLGNSDADFALLADLICGVVVQQSHVQHHVCIVKRKARLRQLLDVSEWLSDCVLERSADPEGLANLAIAKLQEVRL